MTVKELIRLLNQFPSNYEVVKSSDDEGNEFRTINGLYSGIYIPEKPWYGDFIPEFNEEDYEEFKDDINAVKAVSIG